MTLNLTSPKERLLKEKLASLYDSEILPLWSKPFGDLLLEHLALKPGEQILDVACGTGFPSTEIASRLPKDARLIAVDNSSAMLDVAREKIGHLGNVFFKTEVGLPSLPFADDVYDTLVCNLGLNDFECPHQAFFEFTRVVKPKGAILATLSMEGTFKEFYRMFKTVLKEHGDKKSLEKLDAHLNRSYPSQADCQRWLDASLVGEVEIHETPFTLKFESAKEFFMAPYVRYSFLEEWKRIVGPGQHLQNVFGALKSNIETMTQSKPFEVTVVAGLLKGRAPELPDFSDDVMDYKSVPNGAQASGIQASKESMPFLQLSQESLDELEGKGPEGQLEAPNQWEEILGLSDLHDLKTIEESLNNQ